MQVLLSIAAMIRLRPSWAVPAALCLASWGCAGPPRWADFDSQPALHDAAAAAEDDSFPSAAEVGLAEASTPDDGS